MNKIASTCFLLLLLFTGLCNIFSIRMVNASGTIYINADGSIDPTTAPISTTDNVTYVFTDNINDSILIRRNDIIIDGRGFTLNGTGSLMNGITMDGRSNVTVENVEIVGFDTCIWVESSDHINISRNNILIQERALSHSSSGIFLLMSSFNTVEENQVSVTRFGIHLDTSCNNTIIGNNVTSSSYRSPFSGIAIYYSSFNWVRNNDVVGNSSYFMVAGSNITDFANDIDSSNSVGGKPICYWISQQDRTVPSNAGYVVLINCSNVRAENLAIANGNPGIMLVNTYGSTISKSELQNNSLGILLLGSYNNSIFENDLVNNGVGIYFMPFESQKVVNNTVFANNITMNDFGVMSRGSSNNSFYHNNFINNVWSNVGLDPPYDFSDSWDSGYPSGGNYWSDYRGNDTYSGTYQNETGYDGIGDSPYTILIIDRSIVSDRYPLVQPFVSELQETRVAYRDLLHQYNAMFLQLVALNSTINDMQVQMISLNSTSANLQESISNLTTTFNSICADLQRQVNSLNNSNALLSQSLITLQAQLDSINSTLQESINNLLSQNNSLSSQVDNTLYVLYVFVVLTVILIATTFYFAKKKTKRETTRP